MKEHDWTPENLTKTLAQLRLQIEATEKDSAERVRLVEQGAEALRTELRAEKAARVEAERRAAESVENATDREVVKYYSALPGERSYRGAPKGDQATITDGEKAVRFYGVDVDGVRYHGLLDDPKPKSDWQMDLQRAAEEFCIARSILRATGGGTPTVAAKRLRHIMRNGPAAFSGVLKAVADNATEGAELIPDVTLPQLQREAEMARLLEAAIPSRNVSGGSSTLPFVAEGVQPYLAAVPAAGDLNPGEYAKSQPTMTGVSAEPVPLVVAVPVMMDFAEDAIIDAMPVLRLLMAEALRDGTEDALINGDTTATHQDAIASWNPRGRWGGALGGSNDHRRAWKGFRRLAVDKSAAASKNSAQSAAGLMADKLGLKVAHAFGDVIHIVCPEYYLSQLVSDSNVLTLDKFGPSATLLTGQIGAIGGAPLLLSEFMTADLATSGLYTGSGATGGRLTLNRARFEMRRRAGLRMGMDVVERAGVMYLVVKERKTLASIDQAATKNVFYGYNLTTT